MVQMQGKTHGLCSQEMITQAVPGQHNRAWKVEAFQGQLEAFARGQPATSVEQTGISRQ